MMIARTLVVCFHLLFACLAFAETAPEISDGSRLVFPERGFSIEPPTGWEIHRDIPNLTLLLQVPKTGDMIYQRNITLRKGNGAYAIDDYSADEFGKQIVERRAHILPGITNYRLRNHDTVDLTDGRKGLLFYAQLELNGIPMMEMHMIVSTAKEHFILTFSDVADHFDTSKNLPYLDEAFKTLTSIHTETTSKTRFSFLTTLLSVFAVGGALFFGVRKISSRGLAGVDDLDGEGDAPENLTGSSFAKSFSDAETSAISKVDGYEDEDEGAYEEDDASPVESEEDLEYMQVPAEAADESDEGDWDDAVASEDEDEPRKRASPPPIPAKIRKKRAG